MKYLNIIFRVKLNWIIANCKEIIVVYAPNVGGRNFYIFPFLQISFADARRNKYEWIWPKIYLKPFDLIQYYGKFPLETKPFSKNTIWMLSVLVDRYVNTTEAGFK